MARSHRDTRLDIFPRGRGRNIGVSPVAFVMAALLALPVDGAGSDDIDGFTRRFPVRVELDPGSRVVAAVAPKALVPAEVRPLVERAAARATYRTGDVDGAPKPAKLWVTVTTEITLDADDRMHAPHPFPVHRRPCAAGAFGNTSAARRIRAGGRYAGFGTTAPGFVASRRGGGERTGRTLAAGPPVTPR